MSESTDTRPVLADSNKSDHVRAEIANFHAELVNEVRTAVERDKVVIVGMAQNPVVKTARAGLKEAKIEFTYLEYGNYFNNWRRRLAIKMWSGWPTFPQVFVKGKLIGGNEEMQKALADGSFQRELDA